MSNANLQSLQALIAFRDSLSLFSEDTINEIQEIVLSARNSLKEAEQALSECRSELWNAEDTLRSTEKPGYREEANVEKAKTEVAKAEAHFSEVQTAYSSFQSIASNLSNRLIGDFIKAQEYLDERIEAAHLYQNLSVSDFVGIGADTNFTQSNASTNIGTPKASGSGDAENVAQSSLRGSSASDLPVLPNGMEWVEIDKINKDGVDGIPDNLEFRKIPKENMKEMLETFEDKLLPILSENRDVSVDELIEIDKQNATENNSTSLRLCHDSMIGLSNVSDVIVLHAKPIAAESVDNPAANTPAFESGRQAHLEGKNRNSNPYQGLAGREGAADVWDQGWQSESNDRELAFTSGRHRALVAQELGWKFIPARVLGEK